MLAANCDPFDPEDPQCSLRLPNDPFRTCHFCCNEEEDNNSFQKCSDLRSGHRREYPRGWLQKPITDALCYEKGYVNVGEPLDVFWNEKYEKYDNAKANIYTIEECSFV